jgi:glucose-fructose oxidoreductase
MPSTLTSAPESLPIDRPIRYAIVGAGWIAQAAILPAFQHTELARLVTIVSSNEAKRAELAARYGLERTYSYGEYDACLESGDIDAVYIALPNSMHREYTVRAARAGVHVLCEKPMAATEADCIAMIEAARAGRIKLMIAYRLHFDEANLGAIHAITSGVLGDVRLFASTITQVTEEGIRLDPGLGGGALFDAGIYCVNAARYVFRDEPVEVLGAESTVEARFEGVDETTAATLRFPGGRLATFVCSLGAARTSAYRVIGTKGNLVVEPAFSFDTELGHRLTVDGETHERTFPRHDQFAPEIDYFSACIQADMDPEPSGEEGLADVRVLAGIKRSVELGRAVPLETFRRSVRPSMNLAMRRPPVSPPPMVNATPATR